MNKRQTDRGTVCYAPTHNGFTLIEILVSFSIVTILIGILYATFRSTIKTSEAVDQDADSYRIARIVFYRLAEDLNMFNQEAALASSSSITTPFGALRLRGENKSRFISGSNYPDDTIAFRSLSLPPVLQGFAVPDRVEISYSLSEESLIRKAQFRDKQVNHEVGESVLGLNIRYYDSKKQEWIEEWDSSATEGIPFAMEVTLIVKVAPQFKEKMFRTIVGIPLAGAL